MIPDEAVEAAARELWDVNQHDDDWVDDFATYDAFLRHKARMVLEAAAPHLTSAALRGAGEGAPSLEAQRYLFARAEATESQPEPCEYCSIAANALKAHDGSCDGMTEQEWRALRGEGFKDE